MGIVNAGQQVTPNPHNEDHGHGHCQAEHEKEENDHDEMSKILKKNENKLKKIEQRLENNYVNKQEL